MDTVDFSQVIVTVISVLISGGLLTLIGDRLKRHDAKEDKHDEVKEKLDKGFYDGTEVPNMRIE
jgi:hypothetical protein